MTTPNMNLTLPVVSQTPGPTWASEINADLSLVDSHNHTSGKGVLVPVAGLDINADLSLATHSLTNASSVALLDQASLATLNALYADAGDLFWNDGAGHNVRITINGHVNVGATGNIGGMIGLCSVTYASGPKSYTFLDDVGASATISAGVFVGSYVDASSGSVRAGSVRIGDATISASGASTYSLNLPSALPSNTSFVTCNSSGQLNYTSQTNGITRTMLAAVGQQVASATSNTYTGAGNIGLPITIQTTGRPVFIGFTNSASEPIVSGFKLENSSTPTYGYATVAVDITSASPPPGFVSGYYLKQRIGGYISDPLEPFAVPSSSVNGIVVLPAGTYTIQPYAVVIGGSTGTTTLTANVSLFAYEL